MLQGIAEKVEDAEKAQAKLWEVVKYMGERELGYVIEFAEYVKRGNSPEGYMTKKEMEQMGKAHERGEI